MIKMSNSNDVKFDKRVNFTAYTMLGFWVGFIIMGIFTIVFSFIIVSVPFLVMIFENPIAAVTCLIMFYSSKIITHSLMDLSKNKKWINPEKFIKHLLIQFTTAVIATILSIIIYGTNYFTNSIILDFIFLFSIFVFINSIVFIAYSIYSFSIEVYHSRDADIKMNYQTH